MFEFDENLFNDAYFENLRLLQSFNSIERAINDIYSIDGDYDGRGTIENILVDLKFIMKNVDNLDKQMIKVKKILGQINNYDVKNLENLIFEEFYCFDSSCPGEYGANQSYPYLLYKKFLENPDSLNENNKKKVMLIKSIFEKYKYAEVNDNLIYFSLLAFGNGGCGVSAITNLMIDYYSRTENGSELFEKKYGFPLYYADDDGNKHYNYEGTFVKTYLDTLEDETNNTPLNFCLNLFGIDLPDREYIPVIDDVSTYGKAGWKATGLTPFGISKILEGQFSDNSVDIEKETYGMGLVSMLGVSSSWDDVKESLNKHNGKYDYCIIMAHNFEMRSLDSYFIENNNNDDTYSNILGHALLVTDISENGNPIVSSWGYKFELTDSNQTDLIFINVGDTNE